MYSTGQTALVTVMGRVEGMDGDRSLVGVLPRKAEAEMRQGHQESLKGTDGALVSGCMAGICFALLHNLRVC